MCACVYECVCAFVYWLNTTQGDNTEVNMCVCLSVSLSVSLCVLCLCICVRVPLLNGSTQPAATIPT